MNGMSDLVVHDTDDIMLWQGVVQHRPDEQDDEGEKGPKDVTHR